MNDPDALRSIDNMIGRRLRMRRSALKLSQKAVGAHLGVSFQQIQKFESGANRISAQQLFSLSRFLNVEPGYFYAGIADDSPQPTYERGQLAAAELQASLEDAEIGDLIKQINNQDVRRNVVALLRSLVRAM